MKIEIQKESWYVAATTEVILTGDEIGIAEGILKEGLGSCMVVVSSDNFQAEINQKDGKTFARISEFEESRHPDIDYDQAKKLLNEAIREFRKQIVFVQDVKKAMKIIQNI
jgi:hypothetical protein